MSDEVLSLKIQLARANRKIATFNHIISTLVEQWNKEKSQPTEMSDLSGAPAPAPAPVALPANSEVALDKLVDILLAEFKRRAEAEAVTQIKAVEAVVLKRCGC